MKIFYSNVDDFLRNANPDDITICDIIDGCLTDNYLINYKGYIILAIEHYVNCWSSNHHVYLCKETSKRDVNKINGIWQNLIITTGVNA